MDQQSIQWELLMLLTEHYEEDYRRFVVLPPPLMETYRVRAAVAELRDERYVEEQVRGQPARLFDVPERAPWLRPS
jgi:hypothetical protein